MDIAFNYDQAMTLLTWLFFGGLGALVFGILGAFIGAFMTQTRAVIFISLGAVLTIVCAIVANLGKFATFIGGLGWIALWVYQFVIGG